MQRCVRARRSELRCQQVLYEGGDKTSEVETTRKDVGGGEDGREDGEACLGRAVEIRKAQGM